MDCPKCGVKLDDPAEEFLHQKVHGEPFGQRFGLQNLPFVLMPAIAKVMQDYADKQNANLVDAIREREEEDARGPIL